MVFRLGPLFNVVIRNQQSWFVPVRPDRLQFPGVQYCEPGTSTACKEPNTKAVCSGRIDPAAHAQAVVCEHFDHGAINKDMQQQWLISSKLKRPFSYVSLHLLTQ